MKLWGLLLLVALVSAHDGEESHDSEGIVEEEFVVQLNRLNWYDVLEKYDHVVVIFSSSDCETCRVYPQLVQQSLEGQPPQFFEKLAVGVVDCDKELKLCSKYQTSPQERIKLFSEGLGIYSYPGKYVIKDWLRDWITAYVRPKFTKLSNVNEIANLLANNTAVIAGFFNPGEESEKEQSSFERAAAELFLVYPFVELERTKETDAYLAGKSGIERADLEKSFVIVGFQSQDLDALVFREKSASKKNIKEWVEKNAPVIVHEVTPQYERFIWNFELPTATLNFNIHDAEERPRYVSLLSKIARKYRDQVEFNYQHADESAVKAFKRLRANSLPVLVVTKPPSRRPLIFLGKLTYEDIDKFVEDCLNDKVFPAVAAQEAPEDNDQKLVKTIVMSNYRKLVLDSDSDVIVYFYLSDKRCPPCDSFKPEWDKLTISLQGVDHLTIGEMDMYLNERAPGNHVANFPAVQVFPEGDKWHPKTYSGPRDANSVLEWLKTVIPTIKEQLTHDHDLHDEIHKDGDIV